MATLRQRYVDTASSGGDGTTTALSGTNAAYASLQAALNAERGDLVSADVYLRIECAADTGTADTTLVDQNIAGWTTDATRYVEIHAAAGHEAGVEWDTSKYRLSRSGTGGSVFVAVLADMSGGIAYGRVHGLQIEADWSNLNSATRTVGNLIWSVAAGTSGSDVRIYNNHFRWTGTKAFTFTNTSAMVSGSPWTNGASPTPKAYLWNNILSDETTVTAHASATTFINWDNRNHDTYLWNNTLRGALPYGFYGDNGSDRLHYLKNNLVAGVTTAMCLGSYSNARCNYNSTSSAALGYTAGANDRVSQTFTFASATNHAITSGDAGAKDYGVTDPGAGMFDDDILGVTRSGTWDIGAHEYTSSEVPTGTSGGLVVGSETSYVGEGFVGSIEAAGSISSAISLTLTPSGTLTGTGAVSAAVSLTLTSSGTLAGTGALSSAIPITFTAAGALSAVGVLSSTIPLALTSSGAIAGTGAVSSTIPLALTPSGTLTGTGAVSAAVSLTLTPSGALAGLGALASDIPLVVSLGGTLENAGSDQLTGSVGVTLILSATLTGQGALSSAIPITLAPSATLTGTGALASAVPLTVSAASVLTGTGQLVTTMPLALTPSGTLGTVGSGALTSTVGLSLAITATLAGSGALTGTVPLTIAATGTMRNGAPYDLVGAIGLTLGTQGALTGRGALTSAVPLVVSLTADIAVQITGAHPDRIVDVTRDSRTVRVARTARGIDVTRDSRLIN